MCASGKLLAGKTIVVTRAREQASEFVAQLETLGAEVLLLPMVSFAEPEDTAALDQAVAALDKFDWVVFTSRNAVNSVARRFKVLDIPPERAKDLMGAPRVATIGAATTDAALSTGFVPDHEAVKSSGEELANELVGGLRGKRVLLPRSNLANSSLSRILRDAGADVVEVTAYSNVAPELVDTKVLEAIRQGRVHAITLFSPSAYHHLVDEIGLEVLRKHSGKMVLATIGPVTSSALKSDGLSVEIEASATSSAALCGAIVGYFSQRDHPGQ